jgi:hypothetical protein
MAPPPLNDLGSSSSTLGGSDRKQTYDSAVRYYSTLGMEAILALIYTESGAYLMQFRRIEDVAYLSASVPPEIAPL